MDQRLSLQACLHDTASQSAVRTAAVAVVEALAIAASDLSQAIAAGPLAGITGADGGTNGPGLKAGFANVR